MILRATAYNLERSRTGCQRRDPMATNVKCSCRQQTRRRGTLESDGDQAIPKNLRRSHQVETSTHLQERQTKHVKPPSNDDSEYLRVPQRVTELQNLEVTSNAFEAAQKFINPTLRVNIC